MPSQLTFWEMAFLPRIFLLSESAFSELVELYNIIVHNVETRHCISIILRLSSWELRII
ncbi:MAG: hypothetical protein ACPK85_02110 [Methanosarcina sp.]